MKLDDFDKIPCSAKEAYEWMNAGNHCVGKDCIFRVVDNEIHYYYAKGFAWSKYNPLYGFIELLAKDWFKLVPKKREVQDVNLDRLAYRDIDPAKILGLRNPAYDRIIEKQKEHEELYRKAVQAQEKKPDRFAEVDALIKELPGILDLPSHDYSLVHWHKKFARAIVELIEKGKA